MTHQMCGIAAFLQQLWKKNPVWVKTGGLKSLDGPSLQSQPPGVDPGHEGSSEYEKESELKNTNQRQTLMGSTLG